MSLLEDSMKICTDSEIIVELGFLYFLAGEYENSLALFQKAIKQDDSNMLAM